MQHFSPCRVRNPEVIREFVINSVRLFYRKIISYSKNRGGLRHESGSVETFANFI